MRCGTASLLLVKSKSILESACQAPIHSRPHKNDDRALDGQLDLRVHRLARPRSHLFLHLLTFLAMYFVENKHLDQASEYKALFFNDEVSVSAEAVYLRHWLHWVCLLA